MGKLSIPRRFTVAVRNQRQTLIFVLLRSPLSHLIWMAHLTKRIEEVVLIAHSSLPLLLRQWAEPSRVHGGTLPTSITPSKVYLAKLYP